MEKKKDFLPYKKYPAYNLTQFVAFVFLLP